MIGLLQSDQPQALELDQIVEVTDGLLAGLRGVLIKLSGDGKATIRLDELQGVLLIVAAKNLAPAFVTHYPSSPLTCISYPVT